MENIEDFHINYWGQEDLNYGSKPEKQRRSTKRKLGIVLAFIFVLAMLPLFTLGYGKLKDLSAKKVSEAVTPVILSPAPTASPKPTTTKVNNTDIILKGDNYWRIAKRNCGSGKYYLSVQSANNGKPLQPGDTVIISCNL
jgi:hypothetical protein